MNSERESYDRGATLTFGLVKQWLTTEPEKPRFAFPPKEIALLADLRDIGKKLARNDSARRLVDHLIVWVVGATGNAPTAMMLRMVLEVLKQPIERVSLSDLGLEVPRS